MWLLIWCCLIRRWYILNKQVHGVCLRFVGSVTVSTHLSPGTPCHTPSQWQFWSPQWSTLLCQLASYAGTLWLERPMAATQTGLFIHTSRWVHPKQTALIKQQVLEQTWSLRFSEMCAAVWWKVPSAASQPSNTQSTMLGNVATRQWVAVELSIQQKLPFLLWMSDEKTLNVFKKWK